MPTQDEMAKGYDQSWAAKFRTYMGGSATAPAGEVGGPYSVPKPAQVSEPGQGSAAASAAAAKKFGDQMREASGNPNWRPTDKHRAMYPGATDLNFGVPPSQ